MRCWSWQQTLKHKNSQQKPLQSLDKFNNNKNHPLISEEKGRRRYGRGWEETLTGEEEGELCSGLKPKNKIITIINHHPQLKNPTKQKRNQSKTKKG